MASKRAIFTAGETHGRALKSGNQLISHSQDAGWRSLYAATFREAPLDVWEPAIGHPSLIYHLARPTRVRRRIDGARPEQALIGPRRFCVTPGDASAWWRHDGQPRILQLYLRASILEEAISEMHGGDGKTARITPRFAIVDPLLEQLAVTIVDALDDGTAEDGLYIETLAQMIAVHLARCHSTHSRARSAAPRDGLSQQRVRRLLDYIEAHLGDDLSLEKMAAEIGLSPLYLARVFKGAVGKAPHQYVVDRRIERAKQLLRDSDTPITDVAFAAGFSSHSHLSNWFRRVIGVSPTTYRRQR